MWSSRTPALATLICAALSLMACSTAPSRPAAAKGQASANRTSAAAVAPRALQTPRPAHSDPLLRWLGERGLVEGAVAVPRDPTAHTVITAMAFLDLPYLWGGTSVYEGFDCSGFTQHVYAQTLGLTLARTSEQQARDGRLLDVGAEQLAPGDLVFFNTMGRSYSHVGIYVGEGRFVHSPRTGAAVRLESMNGPYWSRRFDGARRAAPDAS